MVSRFAVLMMSIGCGGAQEQASTCTVGATRPCECLDGASGASRCFDASPAIWGACVCASKVTAVALAPATVSHKQMVRLDGTGSTDATGLSLTYAWTLTAPPGSAAVLDQPSDAKPSFVADLVGPYQATLTVGDGLATATAGVTIEATDEPPVIPAFADRAVETGAVTTLDLGGASDPDGDPLVAFTWQVLTQPPLSVAQPVAATAQTTTFTPDVDGDYGLIASVDDGIETTSATLNLHSYRHIAPLAIAPLDVQYSAALDRVVVLDQTSLHVLDPATGDGPVLHLNGRRFSIAPDGKTAAVAIDHAIAIVDLQTAISTTLPLAFDPSDAVLDGNGKAYAWEAGNSRRVTHTIVLASGDDTLGPDQEVLSSSYGYLAPGGQTMVVSDEFSDRDITVFDLSGPSEMVVDRIFDNTALCAPVWFVNANEFIDRCGAWYSLAPLAPLATYTHGFAGAVSAGSDVLVITSFGSIVPSPDDTALRKLVNRVLVDDATPLPHFLPSDEQSHGSYVFAGPAGVRVIVHGATAWGIVRY